MESNPDDLAAEEYEYQYFGMNSTLFFYHLDAALQNHVEKGLKDMEPFLLEFRTNENDKKTIIEDMRASLQDFKKLSKKQLLLFEPEIKKIFKIPSNVLLPEDYCHRHSFSDEEIQKLEKEIEDLQNEFIQEKTFELLCNEELETLKHIQPVYEAVEGAFGTLNNLKKRKDKQKRLSELSSTRDEVIQQYQKMMGSGNLNLQLHGSKFFSKKLR